MLLLQNILLISFCTLAEISGTIMYVRNAAFVAAIVNVAASVVVVAAVAVAVAVAAAEVASVAAAAVAAPPFFSCCCIRNLQAFFLQFTKISSLSYQQ